MYLYRAKYRFIKTLHLYMPFINDHFNVLFFIIFYHSVLWDLINRIVFLYILLFRFLLSFNNICCLFQKPCTVLDQTHVYMSLYIYTYRSLVRPNSETKKTSFVELLLHDFLLINARTPSLFRLTKKQHKV